MTTEIKVTTQWNKPTVIDVRIIADDIETDVFGITENGIKQLYDKFEKFSSVFTQIRIDHENKII